MARNCSINQHVQEISDIANAYNRTIYAIKNSNNPNNYHYIGLSQLEIEEQIQQDILEQERLSILSLLACCEARIRYDYYRRYITKQKSKISRALRSLYKQYGKRIHFESTLLKEWRKYASSAKRELDYLSEAFAYRHWLAHGRYWNLKFDTQKFDFTFMYIVVEAIIKLIQNTK